MFQSLCRATVYVLIFVLTFEHIAMAAADNPNRPAVSANATQVSSEVYRKQLQALNARSEEKTLVFNEGVYGEFKEFTLAMSESEQKEELNTILEARKDIIWRLYANIFYMIYSAKHNRFDQSYKYRDQAFKAIFDFSDEFSQNEKIRDHIFASIYQWALVSAGTADASQRKRIDYITSVFVSDLTNTRAHVVNLISSFEKNGFIPASALIAIVACLSTLAVGNNVAAHVGPKMALAASLLTFVTLIAVLNRSAHKYLVIEPAKSDIRSLVQTKILSVMESYRETLSKTQLKMLPRTADFDKELLGSEDSATKKIEALQTARKRFLSWLTSEPQLGKTALDSKQDSTQESMPGAEEQVPERSLDLKLRDMFLSKVTEAKDVESFFDHATQDGDLKSLANQAIQQDSDLREVAAKGRSFREAYLKKLQAAFDVLLPFSLDPEHEILSRLAMEEKILVDEKEIEITLRQAELLAIEETQQRYRLPSDFDFSQLETLKYTSDRWMQVYDFFRKRFFIHQNKEVQKITPDKIDMEDFKSRMRKSLLDMRERNFLSGIENFIQSNPTKTSLLVESISGAIDLPLRSLSEAKLSFEVEGAIESRDSMNKDLLNASRIKSFFDFGQESRGKDDSVLKDMYNPQFISPLVMNHTVTLTFKGEKVVLSEASFVRLLNELAPQYYSQDKTRSAEERYLVEVARRDAVLADALSFILENPHEESEDFKARLEQKISSRVGVVGSYKTFSEELRADASIIRSNDLLNDIRWYGYSIHTDYWRMRDVDAGAYLQGVKTAVTAFEKIHQRKASPQELFQIQDKERKEILKKSEKRFLTWRQKAKQGTVGSAVFLATVVAGVLAFMGSVIGIVKLIDKPQMPEFIQNIIQEFKLSGGLFGQNEGPLKFQESDPTNHSKEQVAGSSGGAGGSEVRGSPRFRVETNLEVMPRYLNFPLPQYVALETEGFTSPDEERSKEELVRQEEYKRPQKYLEIFTESPIVAHGSFLPLPSPSGYRVADINIKYEGEYLRSYEYKVYFHNLSGQSYARLRDSDQAGGQFHLEISYEPIREQTFQELWTLDKETLRVVNQHLKNIGETEISSNIDQLVSSKAKINAESLANIFGSSAVYTYDREGSSFRWNQFWSDPAPFENYSKFLRNGTFYYQCTGSNTLFKDFMNLYSEYKGDVSWRSVVAEPLVGFTFDGKKVSPIGHQHTLLRTSSAYEYIELDATPSEMDPKYANEDGRSSLIKEKLEKDHERFRRKTKFEKPKLPETPERPDIVGILPNRPKVKTVVLSEFYNPYEGPTGSQQFDILDQKIRTAISNYERESSRKLSETLSQDFLNMFSLIPYMRQYFKNGRAQELAYQYLRLERRIPLQRKDAGVERFLQAEYKKLLEQHAGSDIKAIEDLGLRLENRLKEQHLKLISSGNMISPLIMSTEFSGVFFEFLSFYKQFSRFEEKRIYEIGMCKTYFAS